MKYIRFAILLLIATVAISVQSRTKLTFPKPLKPGDKIALLAPASSQDSTVTIASLEALQDRGYQPILYPSALAHDFGSYPLRDDLRAADINDAFADDSISAILCVRGGYGAIRLFPYLDPDLISNNPKWLIGFSDISALHAYLLNLGIPSIHGVMTGHIVSHPYDEASESLFKILSDGLPVSYTAKPNDLNNPGHAAGILVGGNLAVLNGLADTPYDEFRFDNRKDLIIFLEDVGEKIYAVERMLIRLYQSGILDCAKGIIIGKFTDYSADDDFKSMDSMIHYWLEQWGYIGGDKDIPVVFQFPVGHVSANMALVVGATATLDVDDNGVKLTLEE